MPAGWGTTVTCGCGNLLKTRLTIRLGQEMVDRFFEMVKRSARWGRLSDESPQARYTAADPARDQTGGHDHGKSGRAWSLRNAFQGSDSMTGHVDQFNVSTPSSFPCFNCNGMDVGVNPQLRAEAKLSAAAQPIPRLP